MKEEEDDWGPPGFIKEDDNLDADELGFDDEHDWLSPQALLNTRLVFMTDGEAVYKPLSFPTSSEEWVNQAKSVQGFCYL